MAKKIPQKIIYVERAPSGPGKASTTLGILSICLFWVTWPATVLGVIEIGRAHV